MRSKFLKCLILLIAIVASQTCYAETTPAKSSKKGANANLKAAALVTPTHSDIAYGPHERNKLDVWCANSEKPAPLVIFIHGGGFVNGDKSKWRTSPELKLLLDQGVSCAAINYPFRSSKPIQEILHDAARAVQFLRSKSSEWNLDKTRFAAQGGSAGAGTSLWLTTRDDLADPMSSDPVLGESSRVCACVLNATQATYNVGRWSSFLGELPEAFSRSPDEGPAFYGLKTLDELKSPEGQKLATECDMLAWISKDDGAVLCTVKHPDGPFQDRNHMVHHPKHSEEIKRVCELVAVPCIILRDGQEDITTRTVDFLLTQLKVTKR